VLLIFTLTLSAKPELVSDVITTFLVESDIVDDLRGGISGELRCV
jgi:hypothetical protein